jgi:hypothetical protein
MNNEKLNSSNRGKTNSTLASSQSNLEEINPNLVRNLKNISESSQHLSEYQNGWKFAEVNFDELVSDYANEETKYPEPASYREVEVLGEIDNIRSQNEEEEETQNINLGEGSSNESLAFNNYDNFI